MPMLRMFSSMVVGHKVRVAEFLKKQASRRAEPDFRCDLPHRSDGQHDPGRPANLASCPLRRGRTRESGRSGKTRLNLAETCLPRRKAEERGSVPVWWGCGHGLPLDPGVWSKII